MLISVNLYLSGGARYCDKRLKEQTKMFRDQQQNDCNYEMCHGHVFPLDKCLYLNENHEDNHLSGGGWSFLILEHTIIIYSSKFDSASACTIQTAILSTHQTPKNLFNFLTKKLKETPRILTLKCNQLVFSPLPPSTHIKKLENGGLKA